MWQKDILLHFFPPLSNQNPYLMKSIPSFLFLFVFIVSTHFALATSRTVDNQGSGQFTSISASINASAKGDTIYILGSPSGYDAGTAVKDSLTFIGPGFNPQKQNPFVAYIATGWRIGHYNKFIGLDIQNLATNPVTGNISNITIFRCRLRTGMYICEYNAFSNVVVDGCVLEGYSLFNISTANCNYQKMFYGAVVRNSLFYNCGFMGGGFTSATNLVVDNCTVYGGNVGQIVPSNLQASTFTNNIFYNVTITVGASATLIFNNNFSSTENLNINGGNGNIQGTSPGFVNAPGGTFSYLHDYHLATGSSCIGTGTNGTDMGIYGGTNPLHWDGASVLPQIRYFNVLGNQINQGGSLKVSFQALIKD
jgi:hypothetical protein